MNTLLDQFHNRVEQLTGDTWCPYPSQQFMQWAIDAKDQEVVKAIEHRRTLAFPTFLAGEPQEHLWSST